MLTNDVNVIINCAGNVDMDSRLDLSVKTNVKGPLMLLDLAEDCRKFECFCQISTCYGIIDDPNYEGAIEEKMYVSPYDWEALYKMVIDMPVNDISHY